MQAIAFLVVLGKRNWILISGVRKRENKNKPKEEIRRYLGPTKSSLASRLALYWECYSGLLAAHLSSICCCRPSAEGWGGQSHITRNCPLPANSTAQREEENTSKHGWRSSRMWIWKDGLGLSVSERQWTKKEETKRSHWSFLSELWLDGKYNRNHNLYFV